MYNMMKKEEAITTVIAKMNAFSLSNRLFATALAPRAKPIIKKIGETMRAKPMIQKIGEAFRNILGCTKTAAKNSTAPIIVMRHPR